MSDSMPLMMNLQAGPASNADPASPSDGPGEAGTPFDGLLQGLFATLNDPAMPPLLPEPGSGMMVDEAGAALPNDGKALPPNGLIGPWSLVMVQDEKGQTSAALAALQRGVGTVSPLPGTGLGGAPASGPAPDAPEYRVLTAQMHWNTDVAGQPSSLFERNMLQQLNPELLEVVNERAEQDAPAMTTTNTGHTAVFNNSQLTGLQAARPETGAPAIPVPPQHPQWGQALGERMQWLVGQNLQQAEIRLDPPELGSLEVKIQIHKDTATISFVTPHAQVREAVEAATSRLREMLGDVGLNLGDVNVSQESFSQQQMAEQGQQQGSFRGDNPHDVADDANLQPTAAPLRQGRGLLDTYA